MTARLERVHAYARAHRPQPHRVRAARGPRIAIVAAGVAYAAVAARARRPRARRGRARAPLGLRLVQARDAVAARARRRARAAAGVEEVLVVEDKLPFVESQIKEALYRAPDAPLVLGKRGRGGPRRCCPARGTLGADDVARALARVLGDERLPSRRARGSRARAPAAPRGRAVALAARTPYFCSGCPHNISTRADADQLVGAGIGCHIDGRARRRRRPRPAARHAADGRRGRAVDRARAVHRRPALRPEPRRRHVPPLRLARDPRRRRGRRQHHLQAALQRRRRDDRRPARRRAGMDVPALTRLLALEGVHADRRHDATSPTRYRGVALDPIADGAPPRRPAARPSASSRRSPGVTVLIHDDRCATEERRLRKRGKLPAPAAARLINERVCEGCGDCGEQSTCLSVHAGRDRARPQDADPPGLVQPGLLVPEGRLPVVPGGRARAAARRSAPRAAADRRAARAPVAAACGDDVLVRMPGIGGTGVVTVSQILQMAAHLDGLQRRRARPDRPRAEGRPGDLRPADRRRADRGRSCARAPARADVLIGFDLLGAAAPEHARASPTRRARRRRQHGAGRRPRRWSPTRRPASRAPVVARGRDRRATRARENLFARRRRRSPSGCSATTCRRTCSLLGAAFQHGCLPLSAGAIEEAIRLNGVGGRGEPRRVRAGDAPRRRRRGGRGRARAAAPAPRRGRRRAVAAILAATGADGALRDVLERPRRRPRGLPGRGATRRRYATQGACASPRSSASAPARTPTPVAEAVRARPAQADGLQGRVRGRAPAPRRGRAGAASRDEFGPGAKVAGPAAPAGAARARHRPQAAASAVDRVAGCSARCAPLRRLRGTRARPVRPRARCAGSSARWSASTARSSAQALEQLDAETAGRGRSRSPSCPTSSAATRTIKLRNVAPFREQAPELLERLAHTEQEPVLRVLPMARRVARLERRRAAFSPPASDRWVQVGQLLQAAVVAVFCVVPSV